LRSSSRRGRTAPRPCRPWPRWRGAGDEVTGLETVAAPRSVRQPWRGLRRSRPPSAWTRAEASTSSWLRRVVVWPAAASMREWSSARGGRDRQAGCKYESRRSCPTHMPGSFRVAKPQNSRWPAQLASDDDRKTGCDQDSEGGPDTTRGCRWPGRTPRPLVDGSSSGSPTRRSLARPPRPMPSGSGPGRELSDSGHDFDLTARLAGRVPPSSRSGARWHVVVDSPAACMVA